MSCILFFNKNVIHAFFQSSCCLLLMFQVCVRVTQERRPNAAFSIQPLVLTYTVFSFIDEDFRNLNDSAV